MHAVARGGRPGHLGGHPKLAEVSREGVEGSNRRLPVFARPAARGEETRGRRGWRGWSLEVVIGAWRRRGWAPVFCLLSLAPGLSRIRHRGRGGPASQADTVLHSNLNSYQKSMGRSHSLGLWEDAGLRRRLSQSAVAVERGCGSKRAWTGSPTSVAIIYQGCGRAPRAAHALTSLSARALAPAPSHARPHAIPSL